MFLKVGTDGGYAWGVLHPVAPKVHMAIAYVKDVTGSWYAEGGPLFQVVLKVETGLWRA